MSTSKYDINELLRFLDSDRITNEQKIAVLNHMIDQELEKTESEVDMELIQECTAFIEELHDQKYQITDAKLESRLNAIKAGKSFSEDVTESADGMNEERLPAYYSSLMNNAIPFCDDCEAKIQRAIS